jgi:hypothetical protein
MEASGPGTPENNRMLSRAAELVKPDVGNSFNGSEIVEKRKSISDPNASRIRRLIARVARHQRCGTISLGVFTTS